MKSRMVLPAILLAMAVMLVGMMGCNKGPKLEKVYGVVTLNGEPVEGLFVEFHPQPKGRPGVAKTNAKGEYELAFTSDRKGCLPGPNLVKISAFRVEGNEGSQYLPAEYNSKSGDNPEMLVEISRDNREFNFDVVMDASELAKQKERAAEEQAKMEAENQ